MTEDVGCILLYLSISLEELARHCSEVFGRGDGIMNGESGSLFFGICIRRRMYYSGLPSGNESPRQLISALTGTFL